MAPQKTAMNSNWDPILLISQIVSMQTLHYLTLCLLVPPLLNLFAEPISLNYEGGASNIGMFMDWREMAGRPTVRGTADANLWNNSRWAWSGGKKVGYNNLQWDGRIDPTRGWIIAMCWIAACFADIYYLYIIVRRPRLILDFAFTLIFNHLVLTTYFSASVPTSLFMYGIMLAGAAITVIVAEQLCVKREMREGLKVSAMRTDEEEGLVEDLELGNLRRD
ncbi:integral membrane protein S linking to the trans Golgi network-domain-containing protein [Coprinopsis sp. MPI-PUGE-AT-0042]|nr:integral membrane protein S linking to the trans Golgi network-domain-containing protein [Coprinopsis sp. MPI-PUGE-AT-0042]